MTSSRTTVIRATTLALLALPVGAFAQAAPTASPPGIAQEAAGALAFERGFEALQARRFAEAELALREALRLRPTPATRYNLGLALRGLGRYLEAVGVFEQYLREPEPGAAPERLAAVREELAEIQRATARLELTLRPAAASLRIDGRPIALDPGGLRLDPGQHALDVEAEGFERDHRELTVTPGAQVVLAITLTPRAAAHLDAPPTTPARAGSRTPTWVLPVALGGGALLVGAVVTGVLLATQGVEEPLRGSWGNFTAR